MLNWKSRTSILFKPCLTFQGVPFPQTQKWSPYREICMKWLFLHCMDWQSSAWLVSIRSRIGNVSLRVLPFSFLLLLVPLFWSDFSETKQTIISLKKLHLHLTILKEIINVLLLECPTGKHPHLEQCTYNSAWPCLATKKIKIWHFTQFCWQKSQFSTPVTS